MRWQAKCVIDSAKAVLPFQAKLRRLKDRISPYQPNLDEDMYTIAQGLRQVEWVSGFLPIKGASVLEIGSGWQPMIPLLYSLSGASQVFLTDLNVLLRPDTFTAALDSLRTQRRVVFVWVENDPGSLAHSPLEHPRPSIAEP